MIANTIYKNDEKKAEIVDNAKIFELAALLDQKN